MPGDLGEPRGDARVGALGGRRALAREGVDDLAEEEEPARRRGI
jgi:hypothetical protein